MSGPHLLDLPPDEQRQTLDALLAERGEPPYRLAQIRRRLYGRRTASAHQMTELPPVLRRELAATLLRPPLERGEVLASADGTRKFRFRLADGAAIESVWIPHGPRGTLCLSSQAGCPAGCTFCATAQGGFLRNLSPAEILVQYLEVCADLAAAGNAPISQMVFMGMGEPLLNYRALACALRQITSPEGFGFSPRRVTVSTVGIAPRLPALAREFPQVRLAVSLHSARSETRQQIVPLERRYPLPELRRALVSLRSRLRRITLEYVLLPGINDAAREAHALAVFANATAEHINLLPWHPFPGGKHRTPSRAALERFRSRILTGYRGRVTIRESRGLDIAGACGQLALRGTRTP